MEINYQYLFTKSSKSVVAPVIDYGASFWSHCRLCSKMLRECTELTNFHQTNCKLRKFVIYPVWWQSHIGLSGKEVMK